VTGPTDLSSDVEGDLAADVRRLEDLGDELAGVEGVLRRLDEGTYGTCEVCGQRLDQAALAAQPVLARCPAHPAA
jgi:RNA polymerase-binding transcription factor DksA